MTAISEHPATAPAQRDVRSAILAAAASLFAERGYNATSVREVVEAAGCKKPTLYYYFGNKEQLYLEIIASSVQEIGEVVDSTLQGTGSVRARLHRSMHAYLGHVRERPTVLKLLMSAERHPEQGQPPFDFDAMRQEHIVRLSDVLGQGVATGELRADLDYEEAVLALFGMLDHRLVLFLHGRPLPDDLPNRLLDLFFNGVRA